MSSSISGSGPELGLRLLGFILPSYLFHLNYENGLANKQSTIHHYKQRVRSFFKKKNDKNIETKSIQHQEALQIAQN